MVGGGLVLQSKDMGAVWVMLLVFLFICSYRFGCVRIRRGSHIRASRGEFFRGSCKKKKKI